MYHPAVRPQTPDDLNKFQKVETPQKDILSRNLAPANMGGEMRKQPAGGLRTPQVTKLTSPGARQGSRK